MPLETLITTDHRLQVAETCKQAGAEAVEVYTTDLMSASAINELAAHLLKEHKAIDVLVNNAGRMEKEGDPLEGAGGACPWPV